MILEKKGIVQGDCKVTPYFLMTAAFLIAMKIKASF